MEPIFKVSPRGRLIVWLVIVIAMVSALFIPRFVFGVPIVWDTEGYEPIFHEGRMEERALFPLLRTIVVVRELSFKAKRMGVHALGIVDSSGEYTINIEFDGRAYRPEVNVSVAYLWRTDVPYKREDMERAYAVMNIGKP